MPFELLPAITHPDDLAQVTKALGTAQHEHASFAVEHRLLRATGAARYVAITGRFDYDAATGQPHLLRGLGRDITARRQTEEELEYKNRLLHNVSVLIARIGPDGRFR